MCVMRASLEISRARQGTSVPCKLQQPSAGSKIMRRALCMATVRSSPRAGHIRHILPFYSPERTQQWSDTNLTCGWRVHSRHCLRPFAPIMAPMQAITVDCLHA